eukprot:gene18139-19949_t
MASTKYEGLEIGPIPVPQDNEEKDKESGSDWKSFLHDFNPTDDEEFWEKVREKHLHQKKNGLSWFDCLDEVRADRFVAKYDTYDQKKRQGDDIVVHMMTKWFDAMEMDGDNSFGEGPQALASYERQITKIAKIIINREYDKANDPTECRYSKRIVKDDGVGKTLLHLAAEGFKPRKLTDTKQSKKRHFAEIAACLLERDPDLIYVTSHPKIRRLAVEFALENFDDEVASLLINAMKNKSRIRLLFEYDSDNKKEPAFQFKTFIERPDMKKTMIAVLDSLINPDWPMLPEDKKEEHEKEWYRVPEIPIRYHFFYQILDGDENGKHPSDGDFNHRSTSCLQAICQSTHSIDAIKHPVIRKLADTKWKKYGQARILIQAVCYVMFLITMSVALLCAVQSTNPELYTTSFDRFRLVCEIVTLFLTVMYILIEIDQFEKERMIYVYDKYNWLDIIGLFSLLIIVPLRFAKLEAQWYFATIAYLVNFLRLFKYFPAIPQLGLYSKILYGLLVKEMPVFLAAYAVIWLAFSGSTYLCLRATTTFTKAAGFSAVSVTGFSDILLRGVRALAEGEAFADGYGTFNWFAIIVILSGMMVILVFLLNILIAQLSSTYEERRQNASLEYDIDKALFLTRLENSRFKSMNLRIRHFHEGEFVNDADEIKELLKGWDDLHPANKKNELHTTFQ